MKIKALFFEILFVLILSCGVYAGELHDEADFDFEPVKSDFMEEEAGSRQRVSRLFSDTSLNDSIELKSVYKDSSNNIKALFFKYTGEYPENLYVSINGISCTVDSVPDDSGYVYVYFDDEINVDGAAVIIFNDGAEYTAEITATPIEIVTADAGEWTASEDGHTLYFYNGSSEDITIPNFYNGNIVTAFGGYTDGSKFYNILSQNSNIEGISSVNISEGIITIGNFALDEVSDLTNVIMPDTVEVIGGAAFSDTSLTGDIIIPANTVRIMAYAFMNTAITSVTFNSKLERINSYSFYGCTKLICNIDLPQSLNYLGTAAFMKSAVTGDLVIPSGVAYVGDAAFLYCTGIKGALILEEGVEEIGEMSFAGTTSALPGYTSISLPSTLKKIGPYAFQFCTKITSITLPEGLEVISDGVFNHMQGITDTKMVIPSTVKLIGGDYNVDENTGYGGHVFYDLGKNDTFTAFEVAEGNEYFTAKDGVLYSKDMTRMLAYPRGKRDTVFEIPEGITQIDEMAFSRAAYLNKIILPDSYIISDTVPANVLNQDANNLAVAIYIYTTVNEIAVKDTNPNYTTVDGMLYSKDKKCLWYIPNQYDGIVNIAEGTERIEKCATFIASKSNTQWDSINIPSSLLYINDIVLEVINEYFKGYVSIDSDNIYYTINQDTSLVEEIPYILGDVNMDEIVDKTDASLLLRFVSDIYNGNIIFNKKAADVNSDSVITLADAVKILQN